STVALAIHVPAPGRRRQRGSTQPGGHPGRNCRVRVADRSGPRSEGLRLLPFRRPGGGGTFVVSDAVALLWSRLMGEYGFAGFAERAAPQLIRWESRYGWTRTGYGTISEQETSLARVVARNLRTPEMWVGFADQYLSALDLVARNDTARRKH